MKFEWEVIDNHHQRARIPGGWLVKVIDDVIHDTEQQGLQSGYDWRSSICYVPDEGHYWKIDK